MNLSQFTYVQASNIDTEMLHILTNKSCDWRKEHDLHPN